MSLNKADVQRIFAELYNTPFTFYGYRCKHCNDELYTLRLGESLYALRCKGCDDIRFVRAGSIKEASEKYGNKIETKSVNGLIYKV